MTLNDLMAELQKEYIDSFPQKIADIQSFLKAKDLPNLINAFHKIKGSGKTYGVPEMSLLGEYYERLLKRSGEAALQYVCISLEILQKIHQARSEQKEYPISADVDFQRLPK